MQCVTAALAVVKPTQPAVPVDSPFPWPLPWTKPGECKATLGRWLLVVPLPQLVLLAQAWCWWPGPRCRLVLAVLAAHAVRSVIPWRRRALAWAPLPLLHHLVALEVVVVVVVAVVVLVAERAGPSHVRPLAAAVAPAEVLCPTA